MAVHRSGRRSEPGPRAKALPAVFIVLALVGLAAGAVFGGFILRSLIDATTPSADTTIPGGTVPGGTTPGGTTPGGTTPGGGTTPPPAPTTVQVVVQPRPMYAVQVGAFSSQPQAQVAADQVRDKGLPATVWPPVAGQTDNLYRVRCGLVGSRPAVDAMLAAVRAAGYPDAFVASLSTAKIDLTVTALSAAYVNAFRDALGRLAALLDAELTAWDTYANNGLTLRALEGHTAGVTAAATQVRTALTGTTPPVNLLERHDALTNLINLADASAVELAAAAGGSQDKYPRAMSQFMSFAAAFTQLAASWR